MITFFSRVRCISIRFTPDISNFTHKKTLVRHISEERKFPAVFKRTNQMFQGYTFLSPVISYAREPSGFDKRLLGIIKLAHMHPTS